MEIRGVIPHPWSKQTEAMLKTLVKAGVVVTFLDGVKTHRYRLKPTSPGLDVNP